MRTLFSLTITRLQLARGPCGLATAGSDLLLLCGGMLCPAPRGVLGQGAASAGAGAQPVRSCQAGPR